MSHNDPAKKDKAKLCLRVVCAGDVVVKRSLRRIGRRLADVDVVLEIGGRYVMATAGYLRQWMPVSDILCQLIMRKGSSGGLRFADELVLDMPICTYDDGWRHPIMLVAPGSPFSHLTICRK